ncbi:MAG: cation:proton antiporter [Candidatus Marsarchaeota archaeon]|nr:cation:proton antiporter [Candidatus Marsarchaeota archaeon]
MLNTIELALTVFTLLIVVAQLIALKLRIPYTLVLVFLGIGITALSSAALGTNLLSSGLHTLVQAIQSLYSGLVNSGLFVGLIVPPLIFEAMIHIRKEELRLVIRPSLALATVGVVLATVVAGVVVWLFAGLTLFSAIVFAVIIAPTDTITVLQIFRHIRVPARLATLMNVEAAFNDATVIILFGVILSSSLGLQRPSLFNGVLVFLYSFAGGIVIGLAVAGTAKLLHARLNDKTADITLTIAAVYGSYVLATSLGMSGLIAVAIAGLYFGNTTMRSTLSKPIRSSIVSFWEIAAFLGNAVAFLLIGFETNLALFLQAAALIPIAYAATIIARAATVYPTLAIFNQLDRRMPFSWSNIATLGGVRGALSIALLATLATSGAVNGKDFGTITTMVLGVVFLSMVIQVPLMLSYAARLFGKKASPRRLVA